MDAPLSSDSISSATLRKFLWSQGDLSYKRDSLQQRMHHSTLCFDKDVKRLCILSSRQVGKSYFAILFALEFLLRHPKTIVRVIAPTRGDAEDIVADNLNVILADVPDHVIARSPAKSRWNLHNGSSLRLGALERQFVDKNRGGNASLIIYEECGFVHPDDFTYGVNSVIGPQLMRSKGWELFVSSPSVNPDHPLHTIASECEKLGSLSRFNLFQSEAIDNLGVQQAAQRSATLLPMPVIEKIRSLSKDEVADVNRIKSICLSHNVILSDAFRREFLAEIIRPKTLMVIPNFDEKATLVDEWPTPSHRWLIAIDWGGVRDKTVAYLMNWDSAQDLDIFFDEKVWGPNTSSDLIFGELADWLEMYPETPVVADVPGQLQVDMTTRFGFPVQTPEKTNWLAAVGFLAARFATKNVRILNRCEFLIKSVRGGMFNRTMTDFSRTGELGHMDGLAAAMYGIRHLSRSESIFVHPSGSKFDKMKKTKIDSMHKMAGQAFGKFRR